MNLTLRSAEAEAILAERQAREEFLQAKTRRSSTEEIEQKRDAWIRATQNRKDLAANAIGQHAF